MKPQPYPASWHRHDFHAMGCEMSIWLELSDGNTARARLEEAEVSFRRAERCLSRFDPDSELSWLNSRAGSWTPLSDMLWSVTVQALAMARETGGLFDPTQLVALEAAGYTRSFAELALWDEGAREATAVPAFGQWQSVLLNAEERSILLPRGARLDLGGIAKGYTAQQVVCDLSPWGPCLVDASGDLTAGAAPTGWPGWPVAVAAPYAGPHGTRPELFSLWLVEGTMATSGIDYRRWQRHGRLAHHLIDPRTARPAATDLLTVTVLAKAAARAEAWATAALIDGLGAGISSLAGKNLAAALLTQVGSLHLTPALAPFLEPQLATTAIELFSVR